MHLTKRYSLFRPGGCCALAKISSTTERAILVLCARPNVVTAAQAMTNTRPARLWTGLAFSWTRYRTPPPCARSSFPDGSPSWPPAQEEVRRERAGGACSASTRGAGGRSRRHSARHCAEGARFGVGQHRENEKCRGGVPRRAGEMCTAFRTETNTKLRVRRRGCYFGAERREREAGGRNLRSKESFVIAER